MVHPFHPLAGKEFELVGFGHTWGDQKVYYRKPDQQRVYSMPTSWTDLGPVDAYVDHARPHQGIEQRRPCGPAAVVPLPMGPVQRRDRLGGIIHEYSRAA